MRVRRSPRRKGFRTDWERLEERITRSLTIEFDYSYDSLGFFDKNPAAEAVLQEAAQIIGTQINDSLTAITPNPAAGDTWTARFLDPSTGSERTVSNLDIPSNTILIFVGGFNGQGSLGGQGGYGGYSVEGSADWVNSVQARGGNSTIGIWGGAIRFNMDTDWSFVGTSGPPPANQIDFLTMAEHEIGRVLGLGTSPGWYAWVDTTNDTLTGPHAEATYGGPVPLNPAGQFGDPADGLWADSVSSFGQQPTMDVSPLEPGSRRLFTSLDWAALEDIGWNTDHLVVTMEPPANVNTSEQFGVSVTVEDPDGHVDTSFDGPVILSLAGATHDHLAGSTEVDALGGVANFSDLSVDQNASNNVILASSDGSSMIVATAPFASTAALLGAEITNERVLFSRSKRDRRLIGFELLFSDQVDASRAANPASYLITQTVSKKQNRRVESVPFVVDYASIRNAVELKLMGNPSFKMGGELIIDDTSSVNNTRTSQAGQTGVTTISIRPGGRGLISV